LPLTGCVAFKVKVKYPAVLSSRVMFVGVFQAFVLGFNIYLPKICLLKCKKLVFCC